MAASPEMRQTVEALFSVAIQRRPEDRHQFLKQHSPSAAVYEEVEKLLKEYEMGAGSTVAGSASLYSHAERGCGRFLDGEVLSSRFKITRFIAAGGMGEVYEAEDVELRERIAIKTIHSAVLQQADAVRRFKREVHLARQVTHPNVCRIFDLFRHVSAEKPEQPEILFVSMELLNGRTLAEELAAKGKLSTPDALPLVEQMAAALSAAHQLGIVHRDFKPSNIVLIGSVEAGVTTRAVVTDFGIASRYLSSGSDYSCTLGAKREVAGTLVYMAPEQLEGRPGTPASDIYAFGLVMYEMVTAQHPFRGDTAMSMALSRLTEPPISPRKFVPELSPTWETVILRCLERDPTKRFAHVQDIPAALTRGAAVMELNSRDREHSMSAGPPTRVDQRRALEAAAPKESAVGRSTEIVAMVRRFDSGGLREYLEREPIHSVSAKDVHDRPFELEFALDSQGNPQPAEICLRLDSPDFQPPHQAKKLRVPPLHDSPPCSFLIRPLVEGELVVNLELLKGEEVVVSRPLRTRALAEGVPVREGISILSIPLTISVQGSILEVASSHITGSHLLTLGKNEQPEMVGTRGTIPTGFMASRKTKAQPSEPPKAVARPSRRRGAQLAAGSLFLAMVALMAWVFTPTSVHVEITTIPGSTVRVNPVGSVCVAPNCKLKLRPGAYEVEITHDRYETTKQPISVADKGPNSFQIDLKLVVVADTGLPRINSSPNKTTGTPTAAAKFQIRGWPAGSKVFLDGNPAGTVGRRGTFGMPVTPDQHEITVVVDNPHESGTMHKVFALGEISALTKQDFVIDRPILPRSTQQNVQGQPSAEELAWQQASASNSIEQLEQFRAKYPNTRYSDSLQQTLDSLYWDKARSANTAAAFSEYLVKFSNGAHRGEAQENMAWIKADTANTVPALQDYQRQYRQAAHSDAAGRKIEDLRFQAARNSEDEAVLQSFLKDYPSGDAHDQINKRLDDVVWEKTNKDDLTGLRAYLKRFDRARHAEQAQNRIDQLVAVATAAPPPRQVDESQAVRGVLEQYRMAYEHRDVDELRRIWPGMTYSTVNRLRGVFKGARTVTMACDVVDRPEINGDQAMVRFTQSLNIDGHQATAQLVMKLRRAPNPSVNGSWEIDSVGR